MRKAAAPFRPCDPPVEGAGEPQSLESLYRAHADWLRARVRRSLRGEADLADDIVQETYLRASRVQERGLIVRPRALLSRIAQHLVIDRARRAAMIAQARRAAVPDHAEPEQDAQLLLKQAILNLPAKLQEVLLLSRFEALSYEDISRELGVSVKTVEARMSQALARCAASLRDEGL